MPAFTDEEVDYIKGTADYFGLNHYTSRYAKDTEEPEIGNPSWDKDIGVYQYMDESWEDSASDWLKVQSLCWAIRIIER